MTGIGQNVSIESVVDRVHHDEAHEYKSSGFTLALKSPVIDAVQNVNSQVNAAVDSGGDARVSALRGYAAASGAYGAVGEAGIGTAVGGAVGGSSGAFTGFNTDRYNRQLHEDEKAAIRKKANGDPELEKRLTSASCYNVKCWAQFAEGSAERTKYFVTDVEAAQLQPELEWVKQQKDAGLFLYQPWQKVADAVKSDPKGVAKDAGKFALGGVTAKSGAGLCATGVGCALGGWMMAFGASEMIEGGHSLYNRYNDNSESALNPLRFGFNQLNSEWGDVAYSGVNFAVSVAALRVPVKLNVGVADGLNRPQSIFDVKVPRFNNDNLIPIIKTPWPYGATQGLLLLSSGSKGVEFSKDIKRSVVESK